LTGRVWDLLLTRTTSIAFGINFDASESGKANVISSKTEWKTSDKARATVKGPLFAGGESMSLIVPTGSEAFPETVNAGAAAVKLRSL